MLFPSYPYRQLGQPSIGLPVLHRHCQRFWLANDDYKLLPPGNCRVNQVPLQQGIVLHGQWDDHGWILGPLAFVDAGGIGKGYLIQLPELVF